MAGSTRAFFMAWTRRLFEGSLRRMRTSQWCMDAKRGPRGSRQQTCARCGAQVNFWEYRGCFDQRLRRMNYQPPSPPDHGNYSVLAGAQRCRAFSLTPAQTQPISTVTPILTLMDGDRVICARVIVLSPILTSEHGPEAFLQPRSCVARQ